MEQASVSVEEFRVLLAAGNGVDPLGVMIDLLENDPAERAVVDELVGVLERDGSFREPIVVVAGETGLVIGDGCHRGAAHVRSGIGPVRLQFGHGSSADSTMVRVTFAIDAAPLYGMPLRSFAVGDAWAVADVATILGTGFEPWTEGNPSSHTVCYSYWAPGVAPEDLVAAALQRAGRLGVTATVLDVTVEPTGAGDPEGV